MALAKKQLGALEDLVFSAEAPLTFTQTRSGVELNLTKICAETIPYEGTPGNPNFKSIKDTLDSIPGAIPDNFYTKEEVQTALPKLGFDISNVTPPSTGQMAWNQDEKTVDVGINGVVLQLGQELMTMVRNSTGTTITQGTACMGVGTIGASGRILVAPANMSTVSNAFRVLGIATEDIAPGIDGFVTYFGKVRTLDTSVWNEGDVLYLSNTTPGALTNVEPTTGVKQTIARVINKHATVGTLMVRTLPLDENAYSAVSILTKIKTVDGSGSGLDADLLDGKNAADTGVNTIVQRNASGNALALGSATGTSFNSITGLASVAPIMDGTATVGTSPLVARQDHVHPTDTSRASINSPTFTGIPLAPTATTGTSTTQLATTAFTSNAILTTVAVYAELPSYGLEWNETTDTYTRVGDSDYTRIQRKFRRCVINTDAEVVYYLHPHNSLLKEDGTLADLSGADGNVMVEVPLTYLKYTYTTGTVKHKWEISDKADDGFEPHSCFVIAGEVKKYRYFPAYNGTVVNNKLMSISGTYATVGTSRTALRPLARANGATFCQQDWLLTEFISLMALIEYGTMNIQTGLGAGRSALTGSSWVGGSLIALNGLSNSLGNNSGNYTYTGSADDSAADLSFMSYRGCENFYGNVWKWLDGINISERVPYVCQNPSEFADGKYSGGYVSTGVTMAVSSGSYGRTLGNSSKGFFVTDVSGGASTVGTTDGLWTSTGSMAMRFGGYALNGELDGAFCLSASFAASYVTVGVGGGVAAWSKD